MKLSYEELEQQLAESHRALRAETIAHENTQMQLEKMAAENAGLKFITADCHVAHVEPETFYREEVTRYVSADGYEPETPATDSFLAEVRASGVDMMVEQCESDIMLIEPEDEEFYTLMIEHAKEFPAQLRKGVQS